MIEAELYDGTVLEFENGTPQEVIQRVVREQTAARREAELPEQRTVSLPSSLGSVDTPLGEIDFPLPGGGVTRTMLGAGRNLFTGLARLPFDVADLAGLDNDIGERLSRIIPRVETEPTNLPFVGEVDLERAGQDILPFFAGGLGGARAALAMLPKNAGRFRQFATGLTGAAVGDAAVVDPSVNAGTVGDLVSLPVVGAPTAIEPDDSPGEVRVKQLADAIGIGAAAAPIAGALGAGGRAVNLIRKNVTRQGQEEIVSQALRDAIEDAGGNVSDVARQIDESRAATAGTGFEPTTAQAAADPGLTGLQRRAIGSDPRLSRRAGEQDAAVSRQIEQTTGPEAGQGARIAQGRRAGEVLQEQGQAVEAAAGRRVARREGALAQEQGRLEGVQERLAESRGSGLKEDASAALDETLGSEAQRQTAEKNRRFRGIDPEGEVVIQADELGAAAEGIVAELGRLSGKEGVPSDIIGDIKRLFPEEAADDVIEEGAERAAQVADDAADGTVTFKELQDLRPRINDAITAAKKAGNGRLVENLDRIKQVVKEETERLAQQASPAGERAVEAVRFFKEEFAPKFRTGEGEKFARAVQQGKNIPTKTAFKFIKPNEQGGRESAQQLARILKDAPDAREAEQQVRNFFVGRLVDQTSGAMTRDKITRFMDRHSEALTVFPKVKTELQQLRNAFGRSERAVNESDRLLKEATAGQKGVSERVKKLASTRFFIERDPVRAIDQVFKSDDPARNMRKLLREARRDASGEAREGVKAAVSEWVQQTTRGKLTPENFGQTFKAELDKVEQLFRDAGTREALEAVYSPQELATLKKARDLMRMQNRASVAGRTSTEAVETTAGLADRARIIMASIFGIVKGRAVFTISKLGLKATGVDPVAASMRLLRDALMDPELAKTLLMRPTPEAARRVRSYIRSNIVAEAGQDRDEQ